MMRRLVTGSLLLIVCAAHAGAPAQDEILRPRVCLNGEWQFQPADNDLTFPPQDRWDPTPIRIPSPWNVNSFSRGDGGDFHCFPSYPKSWESVSAAWHRRTFTVPESMRGKALFLRFEAVSYHADVYVNGKKAGAREGGFTPFEIDITDLARVGEKSELLVGVKTHHLFGVKGRATYGWGSFWGGHIRGIWQDVWLIARPTLHVSDAFVMTSVADREITLQISVTNLSRKPQQARINNHIFDADKPAPGSVPAKGFTRDRVSLQPGETKTLTLKEPWASPKLWWTAGGPDNPVRHDAQAAYRPHLYILVTRLYPDEEDNTPLDMRRTRFGFREFRIGPDGKKFTLNGVTWSGRGDAWHFMGIPQLTPDYARAWYEMARSCNINIIRLHAQVYPEYYLDVADEMGMLIVDETALWGSAINFYYNEDFLRRARDHCRELVLRDRNHPSVVLWSVANEIYARKGDDNAPSVDWIFARYAEIADEMKRLDPTREVSSDGDNDLNGRLDIHSLHYPGAGDPKKGKITTIGEAGSMYYSTPPEVAHAVGDRAYLTSNDRMDAVAIETADLIEGYRKWSAFSTPFNIAWYGLEPLPIDVTFEYDDLETPGVKPERLGPYCTMLNAGRDPKLPEFIPNPLYHAVKDAFEPIRFFMKERNRMLWAGEEVTRHLTVHNDVLEASELVLSWEFNSAGVGSQRGREEFRLHPGEMRETEIRFRAALLADPKRTFGDLEIHLSANGRECHKMSTRYALQNLAELRASRAGIQAESTALYDPSGATAEVLAWLGIPFTRVTSVDRLVASQAEINIVGAGSGLAREDALRIDDADTDLIVFENNPGFYGDEFYCSRHRGAYRRGFVDREALWWFGDIWVRFWGDDGIIARAACGREVHGNITPVVRCGDGELVVFAARKGERRRVFSELALIEKARKEPAAALLVWDLTCWEFEGADAPARVLARPGSRFAASMAALGVRESSADPRVVLCDGSRPPTEDDAAIIRRALTVSHLVVNLLTIVGLQPSTLDAWNALLPVNLSLAPSHAAQLIRVTDEDEDPRLNHRDLFWIEKDNTRKIMDWAVSCDSPDAHPQLVTNHTDWRRWCWRGENTKTGAIIRSEREPFTQQIGMLEAPCGDARLIVSQVRLDPLNPKSMRFYNQLLTSLGVPLRRGKATDIDLTPFNIDPDGFITAWLLCGPFDGDAPHDTDFLGGEGDLRPERGTVSGDRLWFPFRARGPALEFTQDALFGKRENCATYAGAYVKAPRDMTANLWLGSDDRVKVWLNGEMIHNNPAVRPVAQDSDKIRGLKLNDGWNFLLFKVSQGTGDWGLCARLVGDDGKPLEELSVSPAGPPAKRVPLSREGWTVTASHEGEGPQHAIDGDPATRWTTGTPQAPDMWFQLDLGRTETVSRIVLDSGGSPGDYPRGLKVETSADGQTWKTVVACPESMAAQQDGVVTIVIPSAALRYVKITQTARKGSAGGLWWSIHELGLLR